MTNNNGANDIGFKLGLFIFIILVLYLWIDNTIDMGLKVILIVLLYFILLSDRCYDKHMNQDILEGFTRREKRIADLNKDRGMLGNFYVPCHKCGRARIIEEKQKMLEGCSRKNNGYCMSDCKQRVNDTMSFYNKKYIDTDQIYCYNCLLDRETQLYLRNYKNFPYVNGPPGTNRFTH